MAQQRNKPAPEGIGQLTYGERADIFAALSEHQLAMVAARLSGRHPALFDEILTVTYPEVLPARLRDGR